MVEPLEKHVLIAKNVLERKGFKIFEKYIIKGLSGFEYCYELVAVKGDRRVAIAFKQTEPKTLVLELAKALDLEEEVVIAVSGSLPLVLERPVKRKRVKLLRYVDATDMKEKLEKIF